ELIRTLGKLNADGPVVLSGALLTAGTPVRDEVRAVLRERGVAAATGGDPAAGAAWLAARDLTPLSPTGLHAALLAR
ncbi:MAG: ATPase, partial [Actinomycetota bacterium]|nr:ATPase [Actinomycetota bacterium]